MPHLIHDVMGHVAVKCPVAGSIGDEFDVACLSDGNQSRCFGPLGRKRDVLAVRRRDSEVMTVDVHRVMVHRAQVA